MFSKQETNWFLHTLISVMDISCFCIHTSQKYFFGGEFLTVCQSWKQDFLVHLGMDWGICGFPKCFTAGWAVPKVQQIDCLLQKFWRMSACHPPPTCYSARSLFAVNLQGYRIALGQNKSDNPLLPWRILLSRVTLGHTKCHPQGNKQESGEQKWQLPPFHDILSHKIIG